MLKSMLSKVLLVVSMCFGSVSAFADQKVEFTTDNTVVLRGEVNGKSVAAVMSQIITSPKQDLYLFINSPGGSIIDGLRLVTLLRTTDKNVTCVTNMAASMAFVILQACPHRLVTEDAIVMQHVASYSIQGQAPNNVSMVSFLSRLIKKTDEMQAKRIGMTYAAFKAKTRDDWWLFDGESVDAKVADDMAVVSCSAELAKKTHKETVQSLFASLEVTWSDCPLVEGPLNVKASAQVGATPHQVQSEVEEFMDSLNWRERLMARFYGVSTVSLPEIFHGK